MYHATVPVFRHYLSRIADIVALAGPDALEARIADSLTARRHFSSAAGFSLRVTCPLIGRGIPDLPQALGPRLAVARATLGTLSPADFTGAAARLIRHRAGQVELEQTATDFLHLYGLPNFFFHMTMGYAALRAAGLALGKADFDGLHHYAPGFRLPD